MHYSMVLPWFCNRMSHTGENEKLDGYLHFFQPAIKFGCIGKRHALIIRAMLDEHRCFGISQVTDRCGLFVERAITEWGTGEIIAGEIGDVIADVVGVPV